MDRVVCEHIATLHPELHDAVEISGGTCAHFGWKTYKQLQYPDFDLTHPSDVGQFDVVICQQVLEHVSDPWRAVVSLANLCRPGGRVIVTTPFLLRLHNEPDDLWRFTPSGMRKLMQHADLRVDCIGSWGNRACIRANHDRWAVARRWHRWHRFMRNERDLPQVVWTFASRVVARQTDEHGQATSGADAYSLAERPAAGCQSEQTVRVEAHVACDAPSPASGG